MIESIEADAYEEPFPHLILHNFYNKEELDLIWEELNFYTKPGKLLEAKDFGGIVDATNSSKYDLDLDSSHRIASAVIPKFAPCINDYLKTYSLLGKCQFLLYDCKLKKIPPGGGFHHWHYESASYTSTGRIFVVQLYLNDDFEGGETEFLYQNKREKAKRGDVLIFPTNFTHTHRGNPPIGGTKYLLTSWGWIQSEKGHDYD